MGGDFDALLEVQAHDTAGDRLAHRRANLPELSELARLSIEAGEVEGRRAEVGKRQSEVAARQRKAEQDAAAIEQRVVGLDRRLYGGTVSSSRDLQAISAEVDSLKQQASGLEDVVLEAMEEREPLDAELARFDAELEALEARADVLRAAVAEAEAAIDAELADQQVARAVRAAGLSSELLGRYERLRARLGGVGVARIEGSRCGGCHLDLPASELATIRRAPPDALVLCEQCGRILVR